MMFGFFKRTNKEEPEVEEETHEQRVERLTELGHRTRDNVLSWENYDRSTPQLHPEFYEKIQNTGVAPLFDRYGPYVEIKLDCSSCSYFSATTTTIEKHRGTTETKKDIRCDHPKGQGEITPNSTAYSATPKWCPYAADYIKHKAKGYEVDSESSKI